MFFLLFFVLLFFGCAESSMLCAGFSSCGEQCAGFSGGFSCCRAQSLGAQSSALTAEAGAQGPWSAASAVVVHRPGCSAAPGALPDRGLNLCPPTGRQTPTHCATREVSEVSKAVHFPLRYRLIQIKLYPINFYRSYYHNHSAKNIFYFHCNLFKHGKP